MSEFAYARCSGRVVNDARAGEAFCLACGCRVYTPEDRLRAEVAVARMATGPSRERNRRPSINGVRLD